MSTKFNFYSTAVIALLLCRIATAQVVSTEPKHWETFTSLGWGGGMPGLDLPHNSRRNVQLELVDTNVIWLAAKAGGLSKADLSGVAVLRGDSVQLYQLGKSARAFNVLGDQLLRYVRSRNEGHTKEFALAALRERASGAVPVEPVLKPLLTNESLIATSWLKKEQSGARTNVAGQLVSRTFSTSFVNGKEVTNETVNIPKVTEICPWARYVATDGEIAWQYFIQFKADGALDYVSESRCDAKEYDPLYQPLISAVSDEVKAEMIKARTFGTFGSVHTFWHLKQEKLKAKGVPWRSPSELNPNTNYD